MKFGAYLREVEETLRAVSPQRSQLDPAAYIGGGQSNLNYLGLRVPQVRQISKTAFSFLVKDEDEVLAVWDYIWRNSDCYEAMCIALEYYSTKRQQPRLISVWPKLKGWADRLDNWAHSDGLSSLYARALEQDRKLVLPTLEAWSKSKNPWHRRQSIVSLIYYSKLRKDVLPYAKLIDMVERQMDHEHYYVQKGVGWTLREIYNVYPKEALKFLERNAEKIPAAGWTAATEKLPQSAKHRLKKLRRG